MPTGATLAGAAGIAADHIGRHFAAITSKLERARPGASPTTASLPGRRDRRPLFAVVSHGTADCRCAPRTGHLYRASPAPMPWTSTFARGILAHQLPIPHGLLSVWQINFWLSTAPRRTALHGLRHPPDYLQQLMMESSGKRVAQDGRELTIQTGAIIWGSGETNGQHLHQRLPGHANRAGGPSPPRFRTVTRSASTQPTPTAGAGRALMVSQDRATREKELLAAGHSGAEAFSGFPPGSARRSPEQHAGAPPPTRPACLGACWRSTNTASVCRCGLGYQRVRPVGRRIGKQAASAIGAALVGADASAYDTPPAPSWRGGTARVRVQTDALSARRANGPFFPATIRERQQLGGFSTISA
ncbi:MAG: hypothetical protein IPH23_11400 [Gammaproteobacteria bacterium]|nr:hypothetical protein [Gammaproteobacteria bacterium]